MNKLSWFEKFKDRKVGRTLGVYLGSAWVFIEAFNFMVDKFNLDAEILNIVILLVIFGLPASIIFVWFEKKFSKGAILLQVINGLLLISVISYTQIKPDSIQPTQLRLLKFKDNQKKLAEAIRSIVVLPFDNFTGDENQEYICEGMHAALINELSETGALIVKSKTTSLAYSGSEKTIKEIARDLNVDGVIEASILHVGENIKVQLKLISTYPEEQQLWAKTYDTDIRNILELYNNVIKEIANEINITLTPYQESKLAETRKVNPEAYKSYLLGMYNVHQLTAEGIEKGLIYLNKAIEIDPEEPLGYAGLALAYLEIEHGVFANGEAYIKANEAANKALKLDTTIAEVHGALAELNMYYFRDYVKAEKHFKKAIDINPNLSLIHTHYAWALFLFGRKEESIFEHELAQSLDPLNPYIISQLGWIYTYYGHYEDGIQKSLESLELQKDYPFGLWCLGETYLALGREEEAIEAQMKLTQMIPPCKWILGYTYAMTNHLAEAEMILEELENEVVNCWNAMGLAVLNGALGNKEETLKWISYDPPHAWIPWVKIMNFMKPVDKLLENDVRYEDLLRRLNVPE